MSHNVYVTMYMSQVLGKGGDEKAGDGTIGICHNVNVMMYMSLAACMLRGNLKKKTLPRTGDGSVERALCMTLILSKNICHTMYMSQSICHKCFGLGVMISYEHVTNETSQEA